MAEHSEWDLISAIASRLEGRALNDVDELKSVGEPLEALLHLAWIATEEKDRVPGEVRLELAALIDSYGDDSAPADLLT